MEFDIEKNKIVGIVDQRKKSIKGDSATIKVVGFIDHRKNCTRFTQAELIEFFPPSGYVFEPGFFINFNWKEGELIHFKVRENENPKEGGDIYRINNDNSSKLNKYGDRLFQIKDFEVINSNVDLSKSNIVLNDENYNHSFFCFCEDIVIGKLKFQGNRIIPEKGHVLHTWNKQNCDIYEYRDEKYLLNHPNENYELLDTMDKDEAFRWLKGELKKLNTEAIDYLNNHIKWQESFSSILVNQDDEENKIARIRLKRVMNNIDEHSLFIEEIKDLAKSSEHLNRSFVNAIERHKKELRLEYSEEIEELKKRNELEKEKLDRLLSKISIEIALKKNELNSVIENINTAQSQIENLNNSKERILTDFSIIKEVLGGSSSQTQHTLSNSFVIETLQSQNEGSLINNKEWFIARLKHILAGCKISTSISSILIDIIASFKGAFIRDEQIALALIEATGNCKYIIQQVEPDWLHFKDLWNNGLGAIWKSSHENPNVLHFLVLEDINLSSPECYMRPLLDCMNGIRKRIPFAMNEFPDNLRILATKISSDEPKIGLPLLEQTFKNWGAVGFVEPIHLVSGLKHSIVDGYIDSTTLSKFKLDDFDIETDALALSSQFKKLFDRPE